MLKVCREIGKEAERICRSDWGREKRGINPLGQRSLAADIEIEKMAMDRLKGEYEYFVSEEIGEVGGKGKGVVVCDPLDGSRNYLYCVAPYSTVLCFSRSRRYEDVYFGYVRDLVTGNEYWADEKGAYFNGNGLKAGWKGEFLECRIGLDQNNAGGWERYVKLLNKVRDMRRSGSNALDMCYVAGGALQCFIDVRKRLSIVHASALYIAQKAGAVVSDEKGKGISPELEKGGVLSFVCSVDKNVHKKVLELIS